MKKFVKKIFRKFGIEITRYTPTVINTPNLYEEAVSLQPKNNSRGNALISYRLEPFLKNSDENLLNRHTNFWRSLRMAETFLELGYCVDVIDYRNKTFIPKKEYAVFIDVRHNLERLSPILNKDCIKIMHIDTAHILFHNAAEARRLLESQQRKGSTFQPRRFEYPNLGIEHSDFATITGNEFTINTYRYANKPIYRVPQSTCAVFPWREDKSFGSCKKNFLWFSSGGMVFKGLDLLLDAFTEMPDYHLYICGPVEQEKDFEKAYHKELYESSNIHVLGWVDVNSPEFLNITNKCLALIYPSCSEGCAGSVITCMHAGIIPIASYESGVDIDGAFGITLKDCSIETIKDCIKKISSLPTEQLKQMARKAWEYARANHTKERFSEEYRKIIEMIIATQGKKQVSA